MKVWAVVPVKRFEAAKSRLSPILGTVERTELARRLLDHVLSVLGATPGLAGVTIVTDSPAVADAAERRGVASLLDPPDARTLGDSVDAALRDARERGATAAVVLMSDLPELRVSDVQLIAGELERCDVVVVRDGSGEHTNALGVHLGTLLPTSFGAADSFHRHCETSVRAGLSVGTPESASLAFDVDTPEDYARLVGEFRNVAAS